MINQFFRKIAGIAGYQIIRGSDLDRLRYQAKHKIQSKAQNYSDPLMTKKTLIQGEPHPVIFDVGAYIGTTAAEYAKGFPSGHVYAFEPAINTFEQLMAKCKNIPNISMFNFAVSDVDRKSRFFINEFAPTNSLLSFDQCADKYWGAGLLKNAKKEHVNNIRLDTFCADNNVTKIDLLKLDVQGTELSAIKGASNLIEDRLIKLIYAEMLFVPTYKNQTAYYTLCDYLAVRGYHLHSIYNCAYDKDRIKQADFLFAIQR